MTTGLTLTGDGGNNKILGGGGDDTLDGAAGNDYLVGFSGNDVLIGGDGNDRLLGNGGDDTLDGGNGDDILMGSYGQNVLFGGDGNDRLSGGVTLDGGNGDDILLGRGTLTGDAGNDTLVAGSSNDTLDGGTGDDTMSGGFGNDTYFVDSALDVVRDGLGHDIIFSSVTYTLPTRGAFELTLTGSGLDGTGNNFANILDGDAGNNSLLGMGGNDTLFGNGGDDFLSGGMGQNTMTGGIGADTFFFDKPAQNNPSVITDFSVGDGDVIEIHGLLTGFAAPNLADFVQLTEVNGNTVVSIDANGAVGGHSFTPLVTLTGVTGLDENTLYTGGNLVIS